MTFNVIPAGGASSVSFEAAVSERERDIGLAVRCLTTRWSRREIFPR
jgi:hypothetical protein